MIKRIKGLELLVFVQLITTCMGWSAVAWTCKGIRVFILPQSSTEKALKNLMEYLPKGNGFVEKIDLCVNGNVQGVNVLNKPMQIFGRLLEIKLNRYFSGEENTFDFPIDWRGYTFFQHKVLEMVQLVPYGNVISYSYLAAKINVPGGARAVGGALRANRTPLVIPCHRVIRKNGMRGGFSAGLSWKEKLLRIEDVALI